MKRKIINQFLEWKDNPDRKPLVLTGLRQCGKTYALKEFGENYFPDFAYFNFEDDDKIGAIFEHDFDTNRIIDELGNIVRKKEIVPGKTLVVLDEIQACPRAITSLKYFCENKRELHIIAAGSLLGVALKQEEISFPVGKVDRLQMYPMSFQEFLWAENLENLCEGIEKYTVEEPLSELYTVPLEKELRYYYAIGGMPEAVAKWTANHNISEVEKIQNTILKDYQADFSKHAPKGVLPKINWIWESLTTQLAKDNKKFVFSHVKAGKRAADLEDALRWLVDAGLVYKLNLVTNPQSPLSAYEDATFFKVYMADVGLLRAKAKISSDVLLNRTSYEDGIGTFKGSFVENYCLSELVQLEIEPYFWQSGNTAEVDFIFESKGKIIPMEAKAEIHTKAKSFTQFCKTFHPEIGIRSSMKNIGVNQIENTKSISLPLYLLWRLEELITNN